MKRGLFLQLLVLSIFCLSVLVAAGPPTPPWNPTSLQEMAAALGILLIFIMGLRWMVAESAQEREEAKKGIIYVCVGLLIVYSYSQIVNDLYTSNIP